MPILYVNRWTATAINDNNNDINGVDVAAGQSLVVCVCTKHDGANRPAINVRWNQGGLNEELTQLAAHTWNNLHVSWWAKLTPTPIDNKMVRVVTSAIAHAQGACVMTFSGLQDIVDANWSVSNYTWVTDMPKTRAGLDVTRYMLASHAHVRSSSTWTPDEMTEVCEIVSSAGTNQKALTLAVMRKQIDDDSMQVGGDVSIARTGHNTCLSLTPVPEAGEMGDQVMWMM